MLPESLCTETPWRSYPAIRPKLWSAPRASVETLHPIQRNADCLLTLLFDSLDRSKL